MTYKLDPRIQSGLTILILVILFVMIFPGIGRAQTQGTFTPRISISETYDDNIDLVSDNEESDWITVVSPGANFQLETQYTELALDFEAGFAFYAKNSSEDNTRYRGLISWEQLLAERLRLNLNNTFSRSEDPITAEDDRITDISRGREVQYRNRGEASMTWQFGAEDLVTFGYRNRLLNSDSDQVEDSRANEGFVDLATWFVPRFGIGLTSDFSRWEFQQSSGFTGIPSEDFYQYQAGLTMNYRWRPTSLIFARYSILSIDFDDETRANSDDYVVYQPTLGLSLRFSPNTELEAEMGYFRQDIENGNGEDGFALNANFNARGQRASLRILSTAGYELDYGSSDNQGFEKFSDNSARIDYQLAEDLGIFATARYRYSDFTEIDRTEHTYGGRAGFDFTFWRWLTVSLDGGHLRRDSNENNQEFTDNRVTLRITTEYPIPFGE